MKLNNILIETDAPPVVNINDGSSILLEIKWKL